MIRQPPKVGAIWFHHEPESSNTSHADVTVTTFPGTISVITSRGPYQLEGARWHLLTKVFSNPESYKFDFHSEILLFGFSYFFRLFLSNLSNFSTFSFFFFCVCACVCVSRMYVRAYLAIPCVSADDNVKHTKSNIRYDNKINKMKQM